MPRSSDNAFSDRMSAYAKRIRALREDHDLTQKQVAAILHVEQRTYSDYELENIRIPLESLIRLAEHYDVDMNYICGITNVKRSFPKKQ